MGDFRFFIECILPFPQNIRMKEYLFNINPQFDLDEAWQILSSIGCEILYGEEDESSKKLYGRIFKDPNEILKECPFLIEVVSSPLASIDWESQWKIHSPHYKNGYFEVDLKEYSNLDKTIRLLPGPGFGDLSHPTTRLVMRLMAPYVDDQNVLDVGCGSGVLSVAAAVMKAKTVWGIDIDDAALEHARKNVSLNGIENIVHLGRPDSLVCLDECVVVMNMIQSEQQVAWDSLPEIHPRKIVTSGVLKSERAKYLALAKEWGWHLIAEAEEDGWLAFLFETF